MFSNDKFEAIKKVSVFSSDKFEAVKKKSSFSQTELFSSVSRLIMCLLGYFVLH